MSRPLIIISLLLAVVGAIFVLAHIAQDFAPLLFFAAILLTDVGILTGS
jgi:hypothetical protein